MTTHQHIANFILERGDLWVHLDSYHPEVTIPEYLRHRSQLVLQVGHFMPIPIPDLVIDPNGLRATLSFHKQPHECFVPWTSVFCLVGENGRGMIWREHMPNDIRRKLDEDVARGSKSLAESLEHATGTVSTEHGRATRGGLRVIAGGKTGTPRRGHLRLV